MDVVATDPMLELLSDTLSVSTNEDWARDYQISVGGTPVAIQNSWDFIGTVANENGVVLDLSKSNGRIIIIDAAQGKFGIRVKAIEASQIPADSYTFDILIIKPDGVIRPVKGQINVELGTTIVPDQQGWTQYVLIDRPTPNT